LIKLDPEYDSIKLKNGFELYVDLSFDPEKHATVTGEIYGLPSHLQYTGQPNVGMPWQTPMELKFGDTVIMFYLAVMNALDKRNPRYIVEGSDRYVMISYENIYACVRDGKVIPINGYVLVEPIENPAVTAERERMAKIGLKAIIARKDSAVNVVYSKVKYMGTPNRDYPDEGHTDDGVDIAVGDVIVSKKVSDIPLQYELHQRVNEGKKLFRIQRRNVFAKL
jgi:hypothetical protein